MGSEAATAGGFKPVEEEIAANLQQPATGYWSKERNHGDSEVKELLLRAEAEVNRCFLAMMSTMKSRRHSLLLSLSRI